MLAKKTYVTYPDADGKKTANVPVDVKFNLKFDPENDGKHNVDQNFIDTVEGHVAGFTFDFSTDAVGSHEAIKQYAQDKPGDSRPATYLDWNKKEGSVKVTISAVKDSGKKITPIDYIKNANTTLNFKINKEDKVLIEVTEVKDGKEVKADVKVAEKDTIDIYKITGKTTRIKITDKEGNKIEPTYANGYADLEWYSGDSTIARVTKDGRITGIKEGKVTVYAQGKYEKGEIEVEVTGQKKSETKVRFNQPDPAKYQIPVGSTRPASAYVITDPIRTYDYTVESSDPTIVAIVSGDEEGLTKYNDDVEDKWFIKGVNKGTAIITVTPIGWDKGITAEFTVTDAVAGYSFNKDTYTVAKGKTVTLYGKMNPLDAAFDVNDYDFIIDDTNIATVSTKAKNVVVTGKNPGTTKITVTNIYNPQVTASATIVVEGLKAESIVMKKASVNLNYVEMNKDDVTRNGVNFINYVKFTPSEAKVTTTGLEFETWTFESDNEGVAVVATNGAIMPTGVGTAVITGNYDDGLNKVELKLTVNVKGKKADPEPEPEPEPEPAKSNPIVVEPEDGKYYINVVKGAKNEKQLIVYDAVTGEEVDVKWSSKDTKMATVSKAGVVKAKGKGRAVITATTLDGTQKYNIGLTLNQKPVEQINVLYEKVELKVGEKFIVGASIYPKHAYNQELGYKSSNKKVVTVDGGILTAKKPGTATITISAKDGSGVKATVEVTVVK